MRLCSGCGSKVPDNVRFCDECKPAPAVDDGIASSTVSDRQRYQFLYESNRFQDGLRPRVLQRQPVCARCGIEPSVIADHIVPSGEAIRQAQESKLFPYSKYAGFFLLSNLQGLCRKCHAIKTAEDKAHVGPWPDVLQGERKAESQATGGGSNVQR